MRPFVFFAFLLASPLAQAQLVTHSAHYYDQETRRGEDAVVELRLEWESHQKPARVAKSIITELKKLNEEEIARSPVLSAAWPGILKNITKFVELIDQSRRHTSISHTDPFLIQVIASGQRTLFRMKNETNRAWFSIDTSSPNVVWWKTPQMQIPFRFEY